MTASHIFNGETTAAVHGNQAPYLLVSADLVLFGAEDQGIAAGRTKHGRGATEAQPELIGKFGCEPRHDGPGRIASTITSGGNILRPAWISAAARTLDVRRQAPGNAEGRPNFSQDFQQQASQRRQARQGLHRGGGEDELTAVGPVHLSEFKGNKGSDTLTHEHRRAAGIQVTDPCGHLKEIFDQGAKAWCMSETASRVAMATKIEGVDGMAMGAEFLSRRGKMVGLLTDIMDKEQGGTILLTREPRLEVKGRTSMVHRDGQSIRDGASAVRFPKSWRDAAAPRLFAWGASSSGQTRGRHGSCLTAAVRRSERNV